MTTKPKLPQDVEEFIQNYSQWAEPLDDDIIYTEHFRAWMSGHVRVPVGLIENTLAAVREELNKAYNEAYPVCCGQGGQECCGSPEPEWPPHAVAIMDALGPIEKELSNILNASKGEGK